ncbi:MAG: hypothetical protein ACRBF0_18435 [Calditrichia bacterium]
MRSQFTLKVAMYGLFYLCTCGIAQDSTLINFKLKDQFDKKYTKATWEGQILVIIGSDREGSKYSSSWGSAISDSMSGDPNYSNIQIAGLSDLRGVPFFLKSYVRGKFPKEKHQWVLMDWKGLFPKTYQFREKLSNILIFGTDGRLIYQTSVAEMDLSKLKMIVSILTNELNHK